MVVGQVSTATEVLVIGGGPGGYTTALESAVLGRSVTLIERDRIGGTCLHVGCIPSKALLHVADVASKAREAEGMGVSATVTVDMTALRSHLDRTVRQLASGLDRLLDQPSITRRSGSARLVSPTRAVIEHDGLAEHIEFEQVVIATGSRPRSLPGVEIDGTWVLDSSTALALDHLPEALVIIGGGYIGVELGTAFAKLGSSVTIVEMAESLLPGFEPGVGRAVRRRLEQLGVEVLTAVAVADLADGTVVVAGSDGERRLTADRVVVATGRTPNTDEVGLSAAGVKVDDQGLIPVDASGRVSATVFAVGDVTAGPALAHKAVAQGRVAARAAAGQLAVFDPACVPEVVFSDPEVVRVGLDASTARMEGIDAHCQRLPLGSSGRAVANGDAGGYLELISDADGTLIGGVVVGNGGSELAGELALGVEMAVTMAELAEVIHPHPTVSELLVDAAHATKRPEV